MDAEKRAHRDLETTERVSTSAHIDLCLRYAIAAKGSCALGDSAGAVSCCVDSALKYRRTTTAHSSSCSSRMAPTRHGAGDGRMRRLISLLRRLSTFVLCNCRWCQAMKALAILYEGRFTKLAVMNRLTHEIPDTS